MRNFNFTFSFITFLALFSLNTFAQKAMDHLVLKTNKGPVVIEMESLGTPLHFDAITKLVEMGIYTGTSFNYAQDDFYVQMGDETFRDFGFYEEQLELIKPIPNEITEYQHLRGSVTMPNSPDDKLKGGQYIFTVMLDREVELDKKQTIIGFVVFGLDILDEASRGSHNKNLLDTPLKINTAVFMTKENAQAYFEDTKKSKFEADIFQFSKYSFLFIVFIQLILFYGKKKIDSQIVESIQLIVFIIAAFSAMAMFYPLIANSTLASVFLVASMLLCFKMMSSLERSRGLSK